MVKRRINMENAKEYITKIADEIKADFEKKCTAEAKQYKTRIGVALIQQDYNEDLIEIYMHLERIQAILESHETKRTININIKIK